ncbi:hypothetical protein ABID70_002186 [Clavibacter michiganensis]|uniref:SHOCT domain-containing protein n=1 Tax=Clavibacter michiganensis TaxID=28447 RepID=UPI001AE93A11|nr:SHOCT domain-containing protein [Clavibacter michiganensis]MBP2456662.1 hypothetical protein [Clavibacter michiganensis]MDQ0409232.1 hypothetical protein [Clavibacter michiganensis]
MTSFGRVIGGAYLHASVTTATFGSDLVVQTGIKGRKLTVASVESWQETPAEHKDSAFAAIGKAAAGVALPGRFGKAASAAVGAAFDSRMPDHQVLVSWVDGTQSLIKLPDALFTHLELVLSDLRTPNAEPALLSPSGDEKPEPTIADKAFHLISGLVEDHFPSMAPTPAPTQIAANPAAQFDVAEQLQKLASLRDAGILTDSEFTTKKAELLNRL